MSPPTSQVAVSLQVCPYSYVAITVDNVSNVDVATNNLQILKC